MGELTYNSLNVQTGMLEDIDEIRAVGIDLAGTLQMVLDSPAAMLMPPNLIRALSVYAVKSESLLRFMSQREQYMLMNHVAGTPDGLAQLMEASMGGLSDTLPATHPDARGKLLQGLLDSPIIPDELKEEARRDTADLVQNERVELPGYLEDFLKEINQKED